PAGRQPELRPAACWATAARSIAIRSRSDRNGPSHTPSIKELESLSQPFGNPLWVQNLGYHSLPQPPSALILSLSKDEGVAQRCNGARIHRQGRSSSFDKLRMRFFGAWVVGN